MAGIEFNIVGEIAQLLRDRYRRAPGEVPILKEIIQNADDAGASELHLIVLEDGFPGAANPLLHGPALVCVNDGGFTATDAHALKSYGSTSKATNHAAIGRFGLGQKSIFHLAEAYFYLGRAGREDAVLADVVDPWQTGPKSEDAEKPEWTKFDEADRARVERALTSWLETPAWFALYAPLRLESHRRARGSVIAQHFPDVSELLRDVGDLATLGSLLPQLHHVRSVDSWRVTDESQGRESLGSASWRSRDGSLSRPASAAEFARPFGGEIETRAGGSGVRSVHVCGFEKSVKDAELQKLAEDPRWPRRILDPLAGTDAPEKAVPHGAATISSSADESPGIDIGYAVFLPLGGADHTIATPGGRLRWRIWLHAYGFPDSGRRTLAGVVERSAERDGFVVLHERWNRRLLRVAALPALLEALAGAVESVDADEGEVMARALASSVFWREQMHGVSSGYRLAWGPRAASDGIESHPQRIPAGRRMLAIRRPDDLAKVGEAIRAWLSIDTGATLVWSDSPILGADIRPDAWSASDLERALGAIEARFIDKKPGVVAYLADALEDISRSSPGVGTAILPFVRRCFRDAVLTVGERSADWTRLAALCPSASVLWSSAGVTLLRELSREETNILILPSRLRPSTTSSPIVSLADARTLLRVLSAKVRSGQGVAEAEGVIVEVVDAIGAAVVRSDADLATLPLFRVWSARESRPLCVTPPDLAELAARGFAFRKQGVGAAEQLARRMRSCLADADTDVLLVDDASVADVMAVPPFSLDLFARAVHQGSRLGTLEQRFDLFKHVAFGDFAVHDALERARTSSELRRVFRLLIHGRRERFMDDTALFLTAAAIEDDFARCARAVLDAMGAGWRVVEDTFGDHLSRGWQAALGISLLTEDVLISAMGEDLGAWRLSLGRELGAALCAFLERLLATKNADALFASLAIHLTIDGAFVAAGHSGTWLETTWPVPTSLADDVRLIVLANDAVVREAQTRSLRPAWSAAEQISLCLAKGPLRHIRELLDALDAASLSSELRKSLRHTRWLATSEGEVIQPGDILDVPVDVDRSLSVLLGDDEIVFRSPGMIDVEARQHPAFRKVLDELALRGEEAVSAIAEQLDAHVKKDANRFWIVAVTREHEREFLARGLEIACLRSDPTWAFVATLERAMPRWLEGTGGRELLNVLRQRPSARRLTDVLLRFRDEKSSDDAERARSLFEDYLRYARERDDFVAEILPQIYLLNANKTWRATTDIAAWDANLQDQFKLFAEHRKILGPAGALAEEIERRSPERTSQVRSRPAATDAAKAAPALEEYFATWNGRVSQEAIGYFLACLGDGPGRTINKLATRYLGPASSVDGAREKFLYGCDATQVSTGMGAVRDASWAVDVVDEGTAREVRSLAGPMLQAKVAASGLSGIFVGDIPSASGVAQWLRLRRVDPSSHEARSLHQALGASVRAFLQNAVGVPLGAEFDAFWGELGRGGQAQIDAVRSMVVEHLPVYLDTLQLRHDEFFRGLLVDIDRAEQRFRERTSNKGTWQDARTKAEEHVKAAHGALRNAVENDEGAQHRIVLAVRRKLAHYQYSVEQVLLELFQNADDAASELSGAPRRAFSTEDVLLREVHIMVDRGASSLRVEHWGRLINRASADGGGLSSERAYELDLKNMLVLNLSDKDAASTGRFGLGFKSVHLLTHRPRVRSGDLSFEIIGGILPRFVPYEGAPGLATRIDLPLDDPSLVDRALARIVSHGALLPVFARTIRRLVVADGERRDIAWTPTFVCGRQALEAATIPSSFARAGEEPCRVLVIRGKGDAGRRFAIALRLGPLGIGVFPKDQPEIWCTAPTLEQWGMGYCINAPFILDVGRGQLARDSEDNLRAFRKLGEVLAEGLRELAEILVDDFEHAVAGLGIEVGARDADGVRRRFWRSMFDRLTELPGDGASDRLTLVRAMHENGGLGAVVKERRVVPTGLPDRHDTLTTTAEVEVVLDEIVARPEVFAVLSQLGWLGKSVTPGKAIHTEVHRRLARIGAAPVQAAVVDFTRVLEHSIPSNTLITPEIARSLWSLWRALETASLSGRPEETLRARLGEARFSTVGGKPRKPSDVLLSRSFESVVKELDRKRYHDLGDELARADFAPVQYVLEPAYAERALVELFLFARQRRQRGDAADLARWAREATDGAKQRAALTYMATGEQADAMRTELEKIGGMGWCRRASELEALMTASSLSESELAHLRIRCGFRHASLMPPGDFFDEEEEEELIRLPPSARVDDPGAVLARIARWWALHGKRWTTIHDNELYGVLTGGAKELRDGLSGRRVETWMLLFTLAACQRLGRQTNEQHAGFVRRLREKRWWTTIAGDAKKVKPEAWIRIIDEWLDERVDSDPYRVWLGLYPTLYQLHRHGTTYRDLLVRADNAALAQAFSLDAHLAPRANPALTGSGKPFDAPPLAPALGIGGSWIFRELVRLEIIKAKPHVVPFCYVPRKAIRTLLQRFGAADIEEPGMTHGERSRRIHAFLTRHLGEQATFEGAFDIPLYLYETNTKAQREAEGA